MKNKMYEHPIISGVLLCVIFNVMREITWAVFKALPQNDFFDFLEEIVDIAWPLGIAAITGFLWVFKAGDFKKTLKSGTLMIVVSLVLILLSLLLNGGLHFQEEGSVLLVLLSYVLTGIREELILRGIGLNLLADRYSAGKKEIRLAILLNALMFGFMHLGRLSRGAALSDVGFQVIFASFLGVMLASMYMYGGSVWAVAVAHTLWDIAMQLEKGPGIGLLLMVCVLAIELIGFPMTFLRLTSDSNCGAITERFNRRRNKRKKDI